jgi:hypothetical protein
MQHDRIFGTYRFWVCIVAHPEIADADRWVCNVSLYPRASSFGTFNGLAVKEARVSGSFAAPDTALDEGELLGTQLADGHSFELRRP